MTIIHSKNFSINLAPIISVHSIIDNTNLQNRLWYSTLQKYTVLNLTNMPPKTFIFVMFDAAWQSRTIYHGTVLQQDHLMNLQKFISSCKSSNLGQN